MAAPLFQHVFQPTEFDDYLEEIGLGNISPEARLQMIDEFREGVLYEIVIRGFSSLGEDEQFEYVRLMKDANKSGDYSKTNEFLYKHIPDIEAMIEEIVDDVKRRMRPGAAVLRKVSDEFLAHIAAREKYESEGEPNLPLDASLIPPTPDGQPVTPAAPVAMNTASTQTPAPFDPIEYDNVDSFPSQPEEKVAVPFPWEVGSTTAENTTTSAAPHLASTEMPNDAQALLSDDGFRPVPSTPLDPASFAQHLTLDDIAPDLPDTPTSPPQQTQNNKTDSEDAIQSELDALKQ